MFHMHNDQFNTSAYLQGAVKVRDWVGLRPLRAPIRVEVETFNHNGIIKQVTFMIISTIKCSFDTIPLL